MDMLDLINDEFGTEYEDDTPWQQILEPGTLPRSPQQAGGPVGARWAGGGGACWLPAPPCWRLPALPAHASV